MGGSTSGSGPLVFIGLGTQEQNDLVWTPNAVAALLFSCALGVAMSYFACELTRLPRLLLHLAACLRRAMHDNDNDASLFRACGSLTPAPPSLPPCSVVPCPTPTCSHGAQAGDRDVFRRDRQRVQIHHDHHQLLAAA